jgi:hypothetical protein
VPSPPQPFAVGISAHVCLGANGNPVLKMSKYRVVAKCKRGFEAANATLNVFNSLSTGVKVCVKQWCSLRETIINHHHHHHRASWWALGGLEVGSKPRQGGSSCAIGVGGGLGDGHSRGFVMIQSEEGEFRSD